MAVLDHFIPHLFVFSSSFCILLKAVFSDNCPARKMKNEAFQRQDVRSDHHLHERIGPDFPADWISVDGISFNWVVY